MGKIDPRQKDIAELLEKYGNAMAGTADNLSQSQLVAAIHDVDGLAARINNLGDSKKSQLLDMLFRSDTPVDARVIDRAFGRAGIPANQLENLMSRISPEGIDVLNRHVAEEILEKNGMTKTAAGRMLKAFERMPKKKAAGVVGGFLGAVGKAFGGAVPWDDILIGTDAETPGGLSNGELPDVGVMNMKPEDDLTRFQYPDLTDAQLNRIEARDQRRDDRARRRLTRNPDGVLELAREEERASQGDIQVGLTTASQTSGNNVILRSLANLIGK